MKKILLALAFAAAALTPAFSQTTQRLSATKANDYALIYSLPVTGMAVTLEAEMTTKKPGEFYKYAKKYLNVDNPITAESHSATLKSATVQTRGIADDEQRYAVQFKSGTSPFMILDPSGIPLAANTEKTFAQPKVALPEARKAEPTALETPAARQVISEEMMQSQSIAKRAELAAQAIFAIRQTRSDLITGQAEQMPPDGASLQLMLDNLEAQEKALVAMFVGTTSTWTDVATFSLTPDEDMDRFVIARISALDGIVDSNDLSGSPVYLSLQVTQRGKLPINEKGVELTFPKGGFAYCIPGAADINISFDGRTYFDEDREFAQFGVVYGLAPNSFTDRKAPIYVVFDPATGSIAEQGPAGN